ncbi:DUF6492 family protein [Halomonas sp. LS-001]
MSDKQRMVFITPTWAGDLDHFRVMRASLEQSPLAAFDHYVVVQDEDIALFEEFRGRSGLTLLSTRDVLPEDVERRRSHARQLSQRLGRNMTRVCGSLKRVFSWPAWPSYTGWHTQQLCKLTLASELDYDKAVIIDSDVIVTQNASADDFASDLGYVCFADWQNRDALKGKVKKWIHESEYLINTASDTRQVNVYFDTPFVFDRQLLCETLATLESNTHKQWCTALLDRPPRRWSEFGIYKAFLLKQAPQISIDWRIPSFCHYLYDTTDPQKVVDTVGALLTDPDVHYVTIHSQASGRVEQDANTYLEPLLSLIEKGR